MDLTIEKISDILSEAFDGGYVGNSRDEVIADIIQKYKIEEKEQPVPVKNEFRIFTASELNSMPTGTVFHHSSLGKCRITKLGNIPYMMFDLVGLAPAAFNADSYPWNEPMKLMSE